MPPDAAGRWLFRLKPGGTFSAVIDIPALLGTISECKTHRALMVPGLSLKAREIDGSESTDRVRDTFWISEIERLAALKRAGDLTPERYEIAMRRLFGE